MSSPIDDLDVELRCDNLSEGVLGIHYSEWHNFPRWHSMVFVNIYLLICPSVSLSSCSSKGIHPSVTTVSGLFSQGCISWHACMGAQPSQPCPSLSTECLVDFHFRF